MKSYNMVTLGTLIKQAKNVRCGNGEYPVLSMTMHDGLVFQHEKFKKVIASKDRSDYKVVLRNQLVISFPIDEGVLATQRITDIGIVSPAYGIWDIDQTKIIPEFLEYALRCNRALDYYKAKLRGSTARRRSLPTPTLLEFTIPLPSINEQVEIIKIVEKMNEIIRLRKKQILYFETIVKGRFVELFGDPINNPKGWLKVRLSDLAEIKIGPFGSLLHKEDYGEGGHAVVNPSHIIDGKIATDDKLTVTDEKFDELSAYQLQVGDVVMGRRGEMGRCAVVEETGLLCGTGSLIIRTRGEVKPDYIHKIISFPSFKKTIEDMAVGQTMPNLNVSIVAGFQIIKPTMEVQESYYDFVMQVNKSKSAIEKSVEEIFIT